MMRSTQARRLAPQRGIALVITLVLLLVMTMIAVVAMRTTTVDLKMTTNTVFQRRAFQSSEGGRTAIRRILAAHLYYRGWPSESAGVAGTDTYLVPDEMKIGNPSAQFHMGTNGKFADLGPPDFTRDADIEYRQDVNNDGIPNNVDMFTDIWVTLVGSVPCPGCSMQTDAGTTGGGASNGGAYKIVDVRASGLGPGNAQQLTGADFRSLVRN
jgi:PilX N-terminal